MPAPTYDATPEALEERYFPGRIGESDEAGYAQAQQVIDEIAGDVAIEVRGAGIKDPIEAATSPNAWAWLTRTILLGAAPQYGRVASTQSVDVFDAWAEEYKQRMGRLRGDPRSVLDDVPAFSGGASSYTAFA